nr:hypothetical protein CFP56_65994 [Quercus suber]
MVATSVLKDLAKTLLSMPVANEVLGIETVPAFALPKAETLEQCLSKELVVCINKPDKPDLKGTLNQEKELRSARMGVGWVCGACRKFKDSKGNTLPIAKLAFKTLKAVGGSALTRTRMPVNVKKLPSIVLTLAGTMKSVRMSGSPAFTIWTMANAEISSEKNFMVEVLEAMEENSRYREEKLI